ncbi:MAG TPA: fatty acid desaturase CarF family protein [Verrucomicrobiae bacterium]|nr:fatty acid desaturase CarF family protein [Verrucomicrobiae bacterium]
MSTALIILAEIAVTVLAADFVAGFVHWLEDAYVREDTPLIGKIVGRPNIIHHHYPRYMVRHDWWETSRDLVVVSVVLVLLAWLAGCLTWQVWLFAILSANANEFHKWEHRTRKENGPVISFLQDIKVLQGAKHHARHHTDPKNSHYCTTTNLLNPVLDGVRFWDGLEWLLDKTIGLKRREDTSVHGHGPRPEWLKEYARPAVPAK